MRSMTRLRQWPRRTRPTRRQPFKSWSVDVPSTFDETFVNDGTGYWHAWDADHSVSLTSVLLTDGDAPVTAEEITARLPGFVGEPIDQLPPGLIGCAAYGDTQQPARARGAISGILVTSGTALVVTITSDDRDWARNVWLSIRHHPGAHITVDDRRST